MRLLEDVKAGRPVGAAAGSGRRVIAASAFHGSTVSSYLQG
jgi:hypothetical protein